MNLTNCKLITSNDKYDFYVSSKLGNSFYCFAVIKDTDQRHTMAGFSTKKQAIHCANTWAGWMK